MLLSIVHGDGIFEHECKNQLKREQSKSNVCTRRYQEVFFGITGWGKNGVKVKPKLRKQDEASPPPLHTKIAFWENFALSTHYMKNFLMKDWDWTIRMWCLNKTSITSSELNDHLHTDTWQCWDVVPPCLQWCFFFRSYRGAKSHDCNKAKEYQMQWNFLYVSKTPLVWPELLFLHSGNL